MSAVADQARTRLVTVYGALAVLNIGSWIWALVEFHGKPAMLGVALVVYGLGMRHAVDADHIAAIDNVTRKLMQGGGRPVGVGFFFAIGHSIVVLMVTAAVVGATETLSGFESLRDIGGLIGTGVSALFLLAVALMNVVIFVSIYRTYRVVRSGGTFVAEDLDVLLNSRGLLARLFRPVFRLVTRSWHMLPLGFLFGLGFDTATEVALFGVSAVNAVKGVPIGATFVFPMLFAAAMALIDTTDGVIMVRAYGWAYVKPMRKLYYNMTITLVSVAVAVLIGGIEALGLMVDKLGLQGGVWDTVAALNANFDSLGFVIIAVFVGAWLISWTIYRAKGLDAYDRPEGGEMLL